MNPKPISKLVVCSECGLDWDTHVQDTDAKPTKDDCIRLLKAELAKRPKWNPTITVPNGGVLGGGGGSGWSFVN